MPEAHKLAVILFADIAGYTAMMQEDESTALIVLNRFKEIVEREGPNHSGQVVQFFGDGAMLAFDSSFKAVSCAAAMQDLFRQEPHVPVRIGMHLGDVLFKNGNAFGNGVNVASRIESLGVPGAVLMSKVIRNQIKNKGAHQLTSLGSFEFKNVEEPMEVFALANPGFVVPGKSEMKGKLKQTTSPAFSKKIAIPLLLLLIIGGIFGMNMMNTANSPAKDVLPEEVRQEKVAVAVFNNFTNDPDLDAFGNLASDWITRGLRELKVKTTSSAMMRKYTEQVGILPGNPDGEASLQELTDAKYVLTGSYYQVGDSLQVIASLESTETGDPIYDFPTIWGLKKDKEKLIISIREQLKGYWNLKEIGKLSTLNPPKYEAYQQFLACPLFDPECLKKVLAIDSTFILAKIHLAYTAIGFEDDSLYQAIGTYIKLNWDKCTEFEKNYYTFVSNEEKKDFQGSVDAMNKNLQLDSTDLDMLHFSAYGYLLLNQPELTVKRLKPVFDQYEIFKDQIKPRTALGFLFALNRLGRQNEVIEYAKKIDMHGWVYKEVIKALLLKGDLEGLKNHMEPKWLDSYLKSVHMFNAIFPHDSTNIFASALRANLEHFADPKPGWNYYVWSTRHFYNWDSKAFAYYQLREWEKAENILLGLRNIDWKRSAQGSVPEIILPNLAWHMNVWREGLLGSTYARQGKADFAYGQIEKLESFRATYPKVLNRMHKGVLSYWKARIHAILGEKEQAVVLLAQSMDEGHRMEYDNFVYDWDLANLKGYEPYEELVRPR